MSGDEEFEKFNEALTAAIQDCASAHGIYITKYVIVAEGLDAEDSQRALWIGASPDVKSWDALGMLTYAIQEEQAQAVRDA